MADVMREHPTHDLELVARAAAGDLASHEAIAARRLLADCAACASLAADLRAIADATMSLPRAASVAATARAPRDFRLTPADAARLRPRGVRGLLRRLGNAATPSPRIGGAIATLGLVGLLVANGVPGLGGGREVAPDAAFNGAGGSMPDPSAEAPERTSQSGGSSPAAIAVGSPSPAATDSSLTVATNPKDVPASTEKVSDGGPAAASTLVVVASAALLVLGLLIVAASWRRRRSIG